MAPLKIGYCRIMLKHLLLVAGFVMPRVDGIGQVAEFPPDEYIEWNEFYKLSWDDFKGHAGKGSFGDAGTSVAIVARPFRAGRRIEYEVRAVFNRKKSWARDSSEALLVHERLHFDIAELYARKVRRKIQEFGEMEVKNIEKYNAAIQVLLEESNHYDDQYDRQTLHGALPKRQLGWQQKVAKELNELSGYKKKGHIIRFSE